MKTVFKKMLSLMLVAMLLVSAVPFQASAAEDTYAITIQLNVDGADVGGETTELYFSAGDVITRDNVKEAAEFAWSAYKGEALEYSSCSIGGDGLTVTGSETVYAYMVTAEEPTPTTEAPKNNKNAVTIVIFEVDLNGIAREIGTVEKEVESLNKALVEEIYKGNYKSYQWQGDIEDGQVSLVIDPIRTENNKKIITLKLAHNDGTSDYETITMLAGDEILEAIKDADISISRNGYYLAGWSFDMNCTDDIGRDDVANEDMTIYAEWEKKSSSGSDHNEYDGEGDVLLRIYLNEHTSSVDRVVNMDAYAKDGKITLSEATKVVKKYYKQASSNDDMDVDGLFTVKTWNSGNYDMDDAKNSIVVNDDGDDTIIYVMVRDAKRISSSSSSSNADTSNPKTGDSIFMAVTVMAASASALALVYFFDKKRAVK